MGLAQDAQDAVARYEQAVQSAVRATRDLLETIDRLGGHLADTGPLGLSSDPALTRARDLLASARTQVTTAEGTATASGRAARSYVDRAFPV